MISLSGWRCAALIRPVLLWMGSRHEAQAVIAKSSASQNGNLECPEPQEKKGNVQVWESRKNCHPRNHRACHGQIQWHKCLQVFVERNAGRFIREGSEKLCPKLSMALTGCFHLPMVPDSLVFFSITVQEIPRKIWAQAPTLAREVLICPFKPRQSVSVKLAVIKGGQNRAFWWEITSPGSRTASFSDGFSRSQALGRTACLFLLALPASHSENRDTVLASFLLSLYLLQLSLKHTMWSCTLRHWNLDYLFLSFKEQKTQPSLHLDQHLSEWLKCQVHNAAGAAKSCHFCFFPTTVGVCASHVLPHLE